MNRGELSRWLCNLSPDAGEHCRRLLELSKLSGECSPVLSEGSPMPLKRGVQAPNALMIRWIQIPSLAA